MVSGRRTPCTIYAYVRELHAFALLQLYNALRLDRAALSSRLDILSPCVRRSWEAWGTALDLARGDASKNDVYIGERRRKLTPSRFTPHFLCSKSELRKNTNCSLVEIDQIKPKPQCVCVGNGPIWGN